MIRTEASFVGRLLVGTSAVLLALSLAGCAPESAEIAGQPEKGSETVNPESSWSQPTDDFDPAVKTTELPETFPSDQFPLPADAVIDDAGSRGESAWFVVLRAPDATQAAVFWSEIVALGGFTESDVSEVPEGGRAATLSSAVLSAVAITIPQEDGSVLLSFDITRAAA
ncbi:hypothetical protein ACR5KS_09210 [Leucobacter sp. W1153]|uniref:hypothetical protein n=1 Tax=Leucobacter sp. W1153 TaxID=3439064 RepID=UPI003F35C781